MIIIDYSAIALASVFINKTNDEEMIRHMVLNTIRMYRTRFKEEYGEVVLAVDSSSWRKELFPQYKANRKKARDEKSGPFKNLDWNESFRIVNLIHEEIKENFPYKVVHVEGCEGDDIIGTLVEDSQEFGKNEPIMIIAADKDFIQLQKYSNVKQFSPLTKKFVTDPNPRLYLLNQILSGDSGDGIPNVLSADNTFVDGLRQTPLTKKTKDVLKAKFSGDVTFEGVEDSVHRNYSRNKMLIDLSETPQEFKNKIIDTYEKQDQWGNKGKVFPYMVTKKLNRLIEDVMEFV